jgi:hypothetical protein
MPARARGPSPSAARPGGPAADHQAPERPLDRKRSDARVWAPELSHVMLLAIVLMGGSVTAGAGDENAPRCGHLRASDADREQVIDALKIAFVRGWLTRDTFDVGVGQALTSRTYAELAVVTADIPARPARARSCRRDSAVSAAPPVVAGQITRGGSIARTVRARWWPRVLVAGLVLVILGVTLVSGESRSEVIFLGVMMALQAAARGLVRQPCGILEWQGYPRLSAGVRAR